MTSLYQIMYRDVGFIVDSNKAPYYYVYIQNKRVCYATGWILNGIDHRIFAIEIPSLNRESRILQAIHRFPLGMCLSVGAIYSLDFKIKEEFHIRTRIHH